jgi:predicted nuclease with RNAse H fold
VIGIDLAAARRTPTGWALLEDKAIRTNLFYTDNEILENTAGNHPTLIAIDAPLSLSKKGGFLESLTKK